MPAPIIPSFIKPQITAFTRENKSFALSMDGKTLATNLALFNDKTRERLFANANTSVPVNPLRDLPGGEEVLVWLDRLPESVVIEKAMPLINFNVMKGSARVAAMSQSLAALEAGAFALAASKSPVNDLMLIKIIQAAFGQNAAAKVIRAPFEPKTKLPVDFPDAGLIDIEGLVRSGELLDALKKLRQAAAASASEAEFEAGIRVLGSVSSIVPVRACANQSITITFSGLGDAPPDLSKGARVVLRIPTAPGDCTYFDLDDIAPGFVKGAQDARISIEDLRIADSSRVFRLRDRNVDLSIRNRISDFGIIGREPPKWSNQGELTFQLPANVSSGPLQFIFLPPAPEGPGSASLLSQVASAFGEMFPQQRIASRLRRIALLHRNPSIHLGYKGKPGDPNWLFAGAPLVNWFTVKESGPIYPRGYVTLSWSVDNADEFEIVAEQTASGEPEHQLPDIKGPLPSTGSMRIDIPCDRRWVGTYILRASNGNPCKPNPATAKLTFESGFSHYLVGVGKSQINFDPSQTDLSESGELGSRPPAFRLAGFADEMQRATSVDTQSPLFARAFVLTENSAGTSPQRVAIVIADIWTCTIALKTAVRDRLVAEYGPDFYNYDQLLIAGTHTHAVPGGYSDYFLYNFSMSGFDRRVFNTIVDAMVDAVKRAHRSMAPGRVLINEGNVPDCGEIRSEAAYLNNVDAEPDLGKAVNRTMQLLRFERFDRQGGENIAIGMLNWYAIHPTSLGYMNPQISGDSKGWASASFERNRVGFAGGAEFVGAFGNSCAGDISGNVGPGSGRANTRLGVPLGNDPTSTVWQANYARMVTLGTLQRDAAFSLFETATEELTGSIASRSVFKDMSNIAIAALPGKRTWPAAIGVSFGAGSSEDSEAAAYVGSVKIIAKIQEGMTQSEFDWGGIEASPYTLGTLLAAASALATGGPAAIPVFLSVFAAAAVRLAAMETSRGTSWFFGTIGKLAFGSKVEAPQSSHGVEWEWLNPDELVPENTNSPFGVNFQHGVKPILFPVGLWQLKSRRHGSSNWSNPINCPLVPHVLPLQVIRIGQLTLAAVPAEFTTMAGRRLTQTLKDTAGAPPNARIIIANYANGYSGYVTTKEEYDMQHYEGASTLYGPYTLEAYRQEIGLLAQAVYSGTTVSSDSQFVVPAIRYRPGCGGV